VNRRFLVAATVAITTVTGLMLSPVRAADAPASKQVATTAESKKTKEILQRWVDAIGGESAVRKLTNRVVKGTLELAAQGISLELKVESQAPNQRRTAIILPGGAGEIVSGYDGKGAWRSIPGQGVVELTGDEARAAKDEAQYWESIDFTLLYSKLEVTGSATAAGEDCHVVEATPAKGKIQKIYFSKKTGLIVRRDGEGPMPDGTFGPTETYYEDYRVSDGMKLAFKIRRPVPQEAAYTFTTSELQHNTAIAGSRFNKPETK
jgi:hypothetical protein